LKLRFSAVLDLAHHPATTLLRADRPDQNHDTTLH